MRYLREQADTSVEIVYPRRLYSGHSAPVHRDWIVVTLNFDGERRELGCNQRQIPFTHCRSTLQKGHSDRDIHLT